MTSKRSKKYVERKKKVKVETGEFMVQHYMQKKKGDSISKLDLVLSGHERHPKLWTRLACAMAAGKIVKMQM